ncbi:TonB family C-terminal domain-containing protein [Saccharicrinis carchari]|uniref:TonB family C-terminal domain-containing protein n=1 Tax=Saccharicrinis carchari TaxID=1168039 RepID=A0A521DYD2_SACCC|nr:energy transducer TonB [Saccharicrinis carchari]SMO76635.1 TonB family C-terminal domain-containing protein [Saccharicrinis carchari]
MKERLFFIVLLSIAIGVHGQQLKTIRKSNGAFYEEYLALASDTSIKEGRYLKRYRDYVIEQGAFKNNQKYGRWAYFSLDGVFEFEYDYNTHKVIKISTRQTPEEYMETPILFHGSPIIPYLYMVRNIYYPTEAKNKNISGKVVLAININKKGEVTSLYLKEKLHPLLDKEVMKVAKTMPAHWQWIPATYHGQNISGEYLIDIEFELTEGRLR